MIWPISRCVIETLRAGAAPDCAREPEQRLREPARQIEEGHVLNLLARVANPAAENFNQFECDLRVLRKQRHEISPVDLHQLAIADRERVGCAGLTVEQRDLAENSTRGDHVENGILAVGRLVADPDCAAQHRKQAGAGVALLKNPRSGTDEFGVRVGCEPRQGIRVELPEERVVAKHCELVD